MTCLVVFFTASQSAFWWQFYPFEVFAQSSVSHKKIVAILVDSTIYDTIKSDLDRYTQVYIPSKEDNIQSLILPILPSGFRPNEIQRILENLYFEGVKDESSSLEWVFLIWDIPLPTVEIDNERRMSIYPYVNFEQPMFLYDEIKDIFTYTDQASSLPNIRHSLLPTSDVSVVSTFFEKLKLYHAAPWKYAEPRIWLDDFPLLKHSFTETERNDYINTLLFSEYDSYRQVNQAYNTLLDTTTKHLKNVVDQATQEISAYASEKSEAWDHPEVDAVANQHFESAFEVLENFSPVDLDENTISTEDMPVPTLLLEKQSSTHFRPVHSMFGAEYVQTVKDNITAGWRYTVQDIDSSMEKIQLQDMVHKQFLRDTNDFLEELIDYEIQQKQRPLRHPLPVVHQKRESLKNDPFCSPEKEEPTNLAVLLQLFWWLWSLFSRVPSWLYQNSDIWINPAYKWPDTAITRYLKEEYQNFYYGKNALTVTNYQELSPFRWTWLNIRSDLAGRAVWVRGELEDIPYNINNFSAWVWLGWLAQQVKMLRWFNLDLIYPELDLYQETKCDDDQTHSDWSAAYRWWASPLNLDSSALETNPSNLQFKPWTYSTLGMRNPMFVAKPSLPVFDVDDTLQIYTKKGKKCASCSKWNCKISTDQFTVVAWHCRGNWSLQFDIINTETGENELLYSIYPNAVWLAWAQPVQLLSPWYSVQAIDPSDVLGQWFTQCIAQWASCIVYIDELGSVFIPPSKRESIYATYQFNDVNNSVVLNFHDLDNQDVWFLLLEVLMEAPDLDLTASNFATQSIVGEQVWITIEFTPFLRPWSWSWKGPYTIHTRIQNRNIAARQHIWVARKQFDPAGAVFQESEITKEQQHEQAHEEFSHLTRVYNSTRIENLLKTPLQMEQEFAANLPKLHCEPKVELDDYSWISSYEEVDFFRVFDEEDAKEKEKLTITVFPRTPSVNTLWLEDTINFFTRQCSKCGSCSGWNCKIEVDENTRLGCNCRRWGKLSIEIIDTSGDEEDLLYVIEPRATSLTWATPIEVLDTSYSLQQLDGNDPLSLEYNQSLVRWTDVLIYLDSLGNVFVPESFQQEIYAEYDFDDTTDSVVMTYFDGSENPILRVQANMYVASTNNLGWYDAIANNALAQFPKSWWQQFTTQQVSTVSPFIIKEPIPFNLDGLWSPELDVVSREKWFEKLPDRFVALDRDIKFEQDFALWFWDTWSRITPAPNVEIRQKSCWADDWFRYRRYYDYQIIDSVVQHKSPETYHLDESNILTMQRAIDDPRFVTFHGIWGDQVNLIYPNLYKAPIYAWCSLQPEEEIRTVLENYLIDKVRQYNKLLQEQMDKAPSHYATHPAAFDFLSAVDTQATPNRSYDLLPERFLVDKLGDTYIKRIATSLYYLSLPWEDKRMGWSTVEEYVADARKKFDLSKKFEYTIDQYVNLDTDKDDPKYRHDAIAYPTKITQWKAYELGVIVSDGQDAIVEQTPTPSSFPTKVDTFTDTDVWPRTNFSWDSSDQVLATVYQECEVDDDGTVPLLKRPNCTYNVDDVKQLINLFLSNLILILIMNQHLRLLMIGSINLEYIDYDHQ
jgi:hypothetical protein